MKKREKYLTNKIAIVIFRTCCIVILHFTSLSLSFSRFGEQYAGFGCAQHRPDDSPELSSWEIETETRSRYRIIATQRSCAHLYTHRCCSRELALAYDRRNASRIHIRVCLARDKILSSWESLFLFLRKIREKFSLLSVKDDIKADCK